MSTDAMGFVKHHDHNGWGDEADFALEQIFSRIPMHLNTGRVKSLNQIRMQLGSHCWICEGWTAIDFEICPDEHVNIDTVPVKLHISCDNYSGETLALNEKKSAALNTKIKNEANEKERIR